MFYMKPFSQSLAALVYVVLPLLSNAVAADTQDIQPGLESFKRHYNENIGNVEAVSNPIDGGERFIVKSDKLRGEGNYPNIMHHREKTRDVVVLVHGLTDSPYYMDAIAKRFYSAGANVIMPLLPAHGLKDPDKAMEDDELADKWKKEINHAVEVARMLGDRVSIGGLSTGGALSVNFALREPDKIKGGLFLFSAALDVGAINSLLGHSPLVAPTIAKIKDGVYQGIGANPYKYPKFTDFGGLQLTRIIEENRSLTTHHRLPQPIFEAHSIHDESARIQGMLDLFRNHGGNKNALVISENPPVEHASVVLETDIPLSQGVPMESQERTPKANPHFKGMMDIAISFFKEYVAR